ncbi:hypothetical protein B0I10_103307 [Flavobacterium lacus]|uniref:Uncharacterized protein n=1 Tax=Flavobacterium lacus TaxID=1353778 RepID=A0A328X106_9FLAO|nr:hypothetical protein B0I10_103307 [Flavobacterium lacus]
MVFELKSFLVNLIEKYFFNTKREKKLIINFSGFKV